MPNTKISGTVSGVVQVEKLMMVTREMPVQDERTRYLIRALATHIRKINEKYPKLRDQMDSKLQ